MTQNLRLTVAAALTLVLTSFHFTDDILHDTKGVDTTGIIILLSITLVYLFGIVELAGRRAGYALVMLGGLAAAYMPFLHSMGPRATRWGWFFIWTMFAMAVTGIYSAFLAGRELWRSYRAPATAPLR